MPRERKFFWTIIGSVVAAVAVVVALVELIPGTPPKATSSPGAHAPHTSDSASPRTATSAPVVTPSAPSGSSFSYISDMTPSSNLSELIYPGPVKIDGSIYPKSIAFSCDNGDLAAFPGVYKLNRNASRFEATVAVVGQWPSDYVVGVVLLGDDGRTLLSTSVAPNKPETIDVNVAGAHTLTLECFTPGISSSASSANIEVAWGNARVTEGH
jgi:hypothetical protein